MVTILRATNTVIGCVTQAPLSGGSDRWRSTCNSCSIGPAADELPRPDEPVRPMADAPPPTVTGFGQNGNRFFVQATRPSGAPTWRWRNHTLDYPVWTVVTHALIFPISATEVRLVTNPPVGAGLSTGCRCAPCRRMQSNASAGGAAWDRFCHTCERSTGSETGAPCVWEQLLALGEFWEADLIFPTTASSARVSIQRALILFASPDEDVACRILSPWPVIAVREGHAF